MHKQNLKLNIAILLSIIFSFTITGCWNRKEFSDISICTALGYDQVIVDNKPKLLWSAYCIKTTPAEGGGGSSSTPSGSNKGMVISSLGENVIDAAFSWNLRAPRTYFISDAQVMLIGEELAKAGISEEMDVFMRQKDLRPRTLVAVCQGMAVDALQAQPEIESLLSGELKEKIDVSYFRASKSPHTDLIQLTRDLLTPGKEVVLPLLKLVSPPESPSMISGNENQSQVSGGQPRKKILVLAGSAVFIDDRMAGTLDEEETQGMLFVTNKFNTGALPLTVTDQNKSVTFIIRNTKTEVKPIINEDSVEFEIKIKGQGNLLEQKDSEVDTSEEDFAKAEELIDQQVENFCLQSVQKCQELNSDVFGFGSIIARSQPDYWEKIERQWAEVFPTVNIRVVADFRIENAGLMSKPIVIK